jgi:hypothetical protein
MRSAIIIHGYNDESEYRDVDRPAPSNDHWIPWLQRKLQLNGILAQAPDMPGFYEPTYESWRAMLERFDLDKNTTLVGHSCGGGFLVRYLSEHDVTVGKVVLVAPWLDPDKEIDKDFFDFEIDEHIAAKTAGLVVMYSTDDMGTVLRSIARLKEATRNIEFKEFTDKGHFVRGSLGTDAFPELLFNLL